MNKVNIVIVCAGAINYTIATVESLFLNTKKGFYLTIINNDAGEITEQYLKTLEMRYDNIQIIENKTNLGVGAAYNQGLDVSINKNIPYTCFCNDDIFFTSGWLDKMLSHIKKDRRIAILGPLRPSKKVKIGEGISTMDKLKSIPVDNDWWSELEYFTGKSPLDFNSAAESIIRANRGKKKIEYVTFPDAISTCVCLCRTKLFQRIGYFASNEYPLYGSEDIDISWTVMKLGYKCAIDKTVYIHHFRNKTISREGRQSWLNESNKVLYSKWKQDIINFIKTQDEQTQKKLIVEMKKENANNQYWLISELNKTEDILKDLE